MAITVVQTASSSGLGGFPVSFTNPVTAGNTVIAVTETIPNSTPVVASPTLGGSAVPGSYAVWNDSGTTNAIYLASPLTATTLWILPNCPTANGFDWGTKHLGNNAGTILYEVSGLGSAPVVNVKSSGSGTGTIDSGTTAPTTLAPAFIWGGSATRTGQASGATGFTSVDPTINGWAGYQIATTAGGTYQWLQGSAPSGWTAGVAAIVATPVPTNQFFKMFRRV